MNLKTLLGPMRPPFLILAPACTVLGIATAYQQTGSILWLHVLLVLLGAISAHISVNAFNEYFDFKSGLDSKTQRTPFSGGSGTLQAHPEAAPSALLVAWVTFGITAAIGIYFLVVRGWALLPLGLLGLLLLVTYTIWWAYHPILCLLAPGIGFGLLMVNGTHFALTGTYSLTAALVSLVPTALVSNLLLLNQFPDVEADQSIGRRHFPITIGRRASAKIYAALLVFAYAVILLALALKVIPIWGGLALLTAILALQAGQSAIKQAENIPALLPAMGQNVLINLLTPVLLAIGIFIG